MADNAGAEPPCYPEGEGGQGGQGGEPPSEHQGGDAAREARRIATAHAPWAVRQLLSLATRPRRNDQARLGAIRLLLDVALPKDAAPAAEDMRPDAQGEFDDLPPERIGEALRVLQGGRVP